MYSCWYATFEKKTSAGTLLKFPSITHVIDRSDRNPPITATSVTFRPSLRHATSCDLRPSLRHASGLWFDLSITCMIDGNFGKVSAGVMFSKVFKKSSLPAKRTKWCKINFLKLYLVLLYPFEIISLRWSIISPRLHFTLTRVIYKMPVNGALGKTHYFWHHNAHEMCKNKLTQGCLIVYFGNLLRAMTVPKWSIIANAKPLMGSVVKLSHFAHSEHLEEVEYFAHTQNTFQVWRVTQNMKC